MLRVLLITREPWRDDSNEGSVLSSWFDGQPMEMANIYCKPGLPSNKCCKRSFQLTDKMAVKKLLKGESMGAVIDLSEASDEEKQPATEQEKKSFYDFFRRNNWASFFLLREALWSLAGWKSEKLEAFVDDFNPDVILAPLCYSRYVMAIQRWAANRLQKPMVGIVWDDLYSFNQWHFSPIYWLNRLLQRRSVKKTVDACEKLYTLSPQQAEAFGKQFHRELGVFPKVGMQQETSLSADDSCVRFIYAGGIYFGRLKTLGSIVETLERLNKEGFACRMDVYSNSPGVETLEREGVCQVHEPVSADELRKCYGAAHVAVHAEGFDRASTQQMWYSFSSKIVDCLSSGCAVLTVCPKVNCGCRYLMDHEAAVCAGHPSEIDANVELLVKDAAQRKLWAQRAKDCFQSYHTSEKVKALVCQELMEVAKNTVTD